MLRAFLCHCWTRFWLGGNMWQVERNLEILSLLHAFLSASHQQMYLTCSLFVTIWSWFLTSCPRPFHSNFIPSWFQFDSLFVHVLQLCAQKRFDFHRNFHVKHPLSKWRSIPAMLPGAKWDMNAGCLADADTMALFNPMPIVLTWDPHQDEGALDHHPFKNGVWHGPHNFCGFFNEWNLVQYLDGGRCRRVKQRCQKWTWTWKRMDMPQKWVWNNRKY